MKHADVVLLGEGRCDVCIRHEPAPAGTIVCVHTRTVIVSVNVVSLSTRDGFYQDSHTRDSIGRRIFRRA